MMKYTHHLFLLIALVLATSCTSTDKKEQDQSMQPLPADKPAEVVTQILTTTDFNHELVSNGKISAATVAELKFQASETISKVLVKNGDRVTKGQAIATLDTFSLNNKLNQAKDALERSKLELQDVLIGQGYGLDNLDEVPEDIMNLAKIKSGFNTSQTQYNMTQWDMERATLTAPISGTVANLFAKPQTLSKPSEVFCNIIDTQNLETTFTVLENELGFIQKGDNVKITPFSMSDLEITGRVSEINPWVDANGMVQVKASVSYNPRLVEGMNVRISTFRSAGKQWVVPKTAVVLRTGRQVVFTIVNDRAIWNYVDTGLENATEYTITGETLKEGDQIIVSGNINLAHEAPVVIIENAKD